MKKIYTVLSLITALSFTKANAQVFTQGDVTVFLQPNGSHDSTQCVSLCQMFYMITVNNSFMGDYLEIKDMFGGGVVYSETNTMGQSPWNVFAPVPNAFGVVTDDQVTGGFANFGGPINKVIVGPDTVANIYNFFQIPVPNPCHYSSVSGQVYVDYNNDCSFNGADVPLSSIVVANNETLNSPSMASAYYNGYSNVNGNYSIQALETWMTGYTVSIPSNYQFIFPLTSCSPAFYSFTTLPQTNVDFSLQCSTNMDVQCAAGSPGRVRPLIPFILQPYVSNLGCTAAAGTLKLILDANVTYNSVLSSNPATSVSGDTLMWAYNNLSNLSNGAYWNSFFAGVYLTPNGTVNIGDTLCFRVMTDVPAADINSGNNDYSFCLPVVNSYDPNLKEVSPKGTGVQGYIPQGSDKLTYTIHFQNTGTATAFNISVIDTLDTDIEMNSLQILGTSHTASPQWLAPGIVKFNFYNINLADSTSNEAASHGFIRFSVNLNPSLAPGTEINNTANIYFDSNPAIVTNTVRNTIELTTGINETTSSNGIVSVYPNPMNDNATFSIQNGNTNETYSFEMTDVLGKVVKNSSSITSKQFTISRSGLMNGIYFYKITNQKGVVGVGKMIVE